MTLTAEHLLPSPALSLSLSLDAQVQFGFIYLVLPHLWEIVMGGRSTKQMRGQLNVRASWAACQQEGQQLVLYTALRGRTLGIIFWLQENLIVETFSLSAFYLSVSVISDMENIV